MSDRTLTGKTRYRTLRQGLWPFTSRKIVLQVEEEDRIEFFPDGIGMRPAPMQTHVRTYWRDARFEDLTISDARELFCRENPR